MNIDDYESLPTTSLATNMTAGAIAGVFEHIVMYPLDSVKTRMQSLIPSTTNVNIVSTMRNMIKTEGILRPIRGATAVVAGAGPAHALYFGSYEMTKEIMTKFTSYNHVNYMLSGVVATLIHDAVSNPTEVIKQRMQMNNSPYKSVVVCVKDVYRKEGFKAFYRSYSTQLVMNIPHQTIHFTTYEFFQNMLNRERKYNPPVHVVAGGAAGACAAAVTTPLDVVKTLLNTQETGFTKGMGDAIKQIYSVAGPMGFFKGLTARVLYSMPATAICWSTYEFFKFYLCGLDRDQYKSSITGKSPLQGSKPTSTVAYVLPITPVVVDDLSQQHQQQHSNAAAVITSAKETASPLTTPATPAVASPASATATATLKTVCELSSGAVPAATINMHTRHTDVKNPYDRGFRSS